MTRLAPVVAALLLAAPAVRAEEELMRKVDYARDTVGHVAKDSALRNGGAARTMEEWTQLRPLLTDLQEFPIDFSKETAIFCSLPSAFDGGSYPIKAELIVLDHGALRVECKAEWPDIFLEKTNTRRYHLVVIPRFTGPIEINFTMLGAEFAAFSSLFSTINIPPLPEHPIFGPAGEASQP